MNTEGTGQAGEQEMGLGVELRSPMTEPALVISDDTSLTRALTDLLRQNHVASIVCEDSSNAVRFFQDLRPGMVVMDLEAARPVAQKAFRVIREFDQQVPIILVADSATREIALRSVDDGAYDLLFKPVEPRLLASSVRRALQYRHLLYSAKEHRRRLEETLEKSLSNIRRKEFLQGILDSSTLVSVVLTDLEQNVLFWNTGAQNIFGYTAAEMIGEKITRLYPPDAFTVHQVTQLQEMVRSKSGTVHGKMKQLAKDGRTLVISLAISPVVNSLGELEGILGIGLDVTEEVRLFKEVRDTQDVTIFALAKLAEFRDEETGYHLIRIQEYCRVLCRRLATREPYRDMMTKEFVEDLSRSAILHDIGKVGIPDDVLLCRGKFTPAQFEIMKRHPEIGGDALDEAVKKLGAQSFLIMARDIAYYHHEHWDGSGYPFHLKNTGIPLSARIVALADVYDALTSARRYKEAFSHENAVRIIVEGKGQHFDPELVEVFQEIHQEFFRIRSNSSGLHRGEAVGLA